MTSPYLRVDECAVFLRFTKKDGTPNSKTCWEFLNNTGVLAKAKRRGRVLLIHVDDLQDALTNRRRAL